MPFPIACQNCRAAFSINEELFERRVAGKSVRFRCPQCKERSAIDPARNDAAARSEAHASGAFGNVSIFAKRYW